MSAVETYALSDERTLQVLEANPHRAMLAVMNISHAADSWLGELERQGKSDRTIGTYRRLLHKLADDHARHVDVRDITVSHIRVFLDSQSKLQSDGGRKAAATVAQNVTIINCFFDWLYAEEIIPRNPTRRNGEQILSRPRVGRPEDNDNVTTISSDDVRKFLAVANKSGWSARLAVNVAIYTGARRSALSNLRLSDYDAANRRLTFKEKGAKTISKPISDDLAQIIDAAIIAGVYETDDDYLIPSHASQRRKGERDDRIIWRIIRDIATKAGVDTHVHALRAAFAVHYLETHPGDVVALQSLMGHDRMETTLIYLRRYDRAQRMETVRTLSWGETPEIPEIAGKPLESDLLTEKEGFEPSSGANPHPEQAGSQRVVPAPVAKRLEELRARARETRHHRP